jgi:hypothetical protein
MGRAPGTGKTTGKNNKIGNALHLEVESSLPEETRHFNILRGFKGGLRLNRGHFSTNRALHHQNGSVILPLGRLCTGGLTIAGCDQIFFQLLLLRCIQNLLVTRRRQIMHREILGRRCRSRRRVGWEAHQGHVCEGNRTAAKDEAEQNRSRQNRRPRAP